MRVGAFSGRYYEGKRRNYGFDVAITLATSGPLTYSGILDRMAIEESKRSQENLVNIKRRIKSSVERALNKLHKYDYISGRNLINKYQRKQYKLTLKGVFALLVSLDGFELK